VQQGVACLRVQGLRQLRLGVGAGCHCCGAFCLVGVFILLCQVGAGLVLVGGVRFRLGAGGAGVLLTWARVERVGCGVGADCSGVSQLR